jgi:hypothetical protein
MFATYHSSLLRPLGAASTFARELTKVEDKQSDIEGGGKGRLDQHSGSIESATGVTE